MNKLISIALATAIFTTSSFAQTDIKFGAKIELGAQVANLVEDTTSDNQLIINNRGILYFSNETKSGDDITDKDPIVVNVQNGIQLGEAIEDDEGAVQLSTAKTNSELNTISAAYPIDALVGGVLFNGGEAEDGAAAYADVNAAETALDSKGFKFSVDDDIYLDLTEDQNNTENLVMSSHEAITGKNVYVTVPELYSVTSLDANFAGLGTTAVEDAAHASRIILKGNSYMAETDNFTLNANIEKQGTLGIDCYGAESEAKYVYVGATEKGPSKLMTIETNNHLVIPAADGTAKTFEVPGNSTMVVKGFVDSKAGIEGASKAGKVKVAGRIVVENGGKVYLGAKDHDE